MTQGRGIAEPGYVAEPDSSARATLGVRFRRAFSNESTFWHRLVEQDLGEQFSSTAKALDLWGKPFWIFFVALQHTISDNPRLSLSCVSWTVMLNQEDDFGPAFPEYVGGLFERGIGDTSVHCGEPCVCMVCCVKLEDILF